ncbi:MAG: hypothetical protein IJK44_02295 [Bacteroidales bacterium]|nr:hypothetical protein [Bacteroidales bacterium]MBQ6198052.1 hypothetical protein [Bacteroidales bacterium]
MEIPSAHARYEKAWHQYLRELVHHPGLCLARYLRYKHVDRRGFEHWMYSNGYSVQAAKERALALTMDSVVPDAPAPSSFLPVHFTERQDEAKQRDDILTGVSVTFPDGTVVSIRRGSAPSVVSFLKLYSSEGLPCSD